MNLPEINFSELDIHEIGSWPLILRAAIICLAGVVVLSVAVYLDVQIKYADYKQQKKLVAEKLDSFKSKYNLAINLGAYEKQMLEIKEAYKSMLKVLPNSAQLPELISIITKQADSDNLKYQAIKPGEAKTAQGFYKELPIDLTVSGTYDGIGSFVGELAKIPRIITMHDFNLKSTGIDKNPNLPADLVMSMQLKSYWLTSEEENKKAAEKSAAGAAGAASGVTTNKADTGKTAVEDKLKPRDPIKPENSSSKQIDKKPIAPEKTGKQDDS